MNFSKQKQAVFRSLFFHNHHFHQNHLVLQFPHGKSRLSACFFRFHLIGLLLFSFPTGEHNSRQRDNSQHAPKGDVALIPRPRVIRRWDVGIRGAC